MKRSIAFLAFALLPLTASAAANCNRACLKTTLESYLQAVVKHDPAAAPLSGAYRHTENAINVPLGKGIWQAAQALGKVQRRYADPVSGQVAYYGTIEEAAGKIAIVTARLRIEDRKVVEGEWFIVHEEDPGLPGATPPSWWNPKALAETPPPERVIPPNKRLPRDEMIAIVDSYFDGITSHDGTVVRAHRGCNRYENGTKVTGRRGGQDDDCVSGFKDFDLANVAARRIPLVDDEQGVVLGMAVFIRRPNSIRPRNAFSEWFVIEDGKIRDIWTAMYYPGPERPVPNWPPFEANFPLDYGAPAAAPAPSATP